MLAGLNHLTLATADLSRSIRFYQEALGARLRARWAAGAYLAVGDLWLCLSLDEARQQGAGRDYTHYAFSVAPADFAALRERLLAVPVQAWKDNSSEGDSFYFLDPDGHRLEIHVGTLESRLAECRRHPYRDMQFFD
ncbi:fosfomycin resistance glutathione transferase [Pseudomonas sp. CAN2814]|uniref:fosfomycin resistance glutathione transferase n=1 Tax=Pseudomonas sp. CAN1 TaxID=3046726 RepID=UPI002648FC88|nr:fosfomycin resistance glutathione transferase [Pseudomonas sp. CAN1]MDN6859863.1 fosfomycin resistance glutathione transferase [Pseudomonas sp. CAN1]